LRGRGVVGRERGGCGVMWRALASIAATFLAFYIAWLDASATGWAAAWGFTLGGFCWWLAENYR
jgi:hypothetical protein